MCRGHNSEVSVDCLLNHSAAIIPTKRVRYLVGYSMHQLICFGMQISPRTIACMAVYSVTWMNDDLAPPVSLIPLGLIFTDE